MNTYTAPQVYDALIRQGFDEERARAMAMAIGQSRVTPQQLNQGYNSLGIKDASLPSGTDGGQGSSFWPNLTEGIGITAASGLIKDKPKIEVPKDAAWTKKVGAELSNRGRGAARFIVPALGGNIGFLAGQALSGTNFYDRASTPQILADIGGSYGGAWAGEKLGEKVTKSLGKQAVRKPLEKSLGKTAAKLATKGLASRLAGSALGRIAGASLGTILGPAGSIVGGTLGGWLIPKLFDNESKSVDEENYYENPL